MLKEYDDMTEKIKNSNDKYVWCNQTNRITKNFYNDQANIITKIFFDEKKLVIISVKTIYFDLPIEVNKILEHEIKSIIMCNES